MNPVRTVTVKVDGESVDVPEGATILDAVKAAGGFVPTLCFGETLTPVNVCRICMVEVEGNRVLVPACSRTVEAGQVVRTTNDRVVAARRSVIELLASAVDMSTTPGFERWVQEYNADVERYGVRGEEAAPGAGGALPKIDNDLYVREYAKCILCYKCVDACGEQWQNTFAIAIAGRGFAATISTEHDVPLPESACVYCGNCIAVCPTGALSAKAEFDLRQLGRWDETSQTRTDTVCGYCGVGCPVTLHVQDGEIVKVTSPLDHDVTHGNLCIKGRFGFTHVHGS